MRYLTKTNKIITRKSRSALVAGIMLVAAGFAPLADATNRKDELTLRPAMMSNKAATALLTAVSVVGKHVAVVGEWGHILTSSDNGQTWTQGNVPIQELLTGVFFVSEQEGWAIGHEAVILHTADGGANWEVQYANPYKKFTDAELDSLSEEEFNQIPRYGSPLLDIWFKNKDEGFVVGAYGVLLHTADGGKTWDDWSSNLDNPDNWHLNAVSSLDGNTLYIAGEKGLLFRSEDGGATWTTLASPYDGSFFGLLMGATSAQVLVFGLQGNIFHSADSGDTWEEVKSPTENSLMFGQALSPQHVILVGNSGTILTSRDGAQTFTLHTSEERQGFVGVAKLENGQLILVGQGGVKLTSPDAF